MTGKTDVQKNFSSLTLAYIGDGVYELFIRSKLLENGDMRVKDLHRKAKNYVSARAQCLIFTYLEESLNETELSVYRRGRNTKVHTKAKNADLHEYQVATGLEALVGFLYLSDEKERLNDILEKCFCIANSTNEDKSASEH